jgi:hypothetical protein
MKLKTMKNSTFKLIPVLFNTILLVQCFTLLPKDQREKVWIENETKLTAEEAYNLANAHLTIATGGTNPSDLRDRSAKRIIINYVVHKCTVPSYYSSGTNPNQHEFKLDFEAKDNRVRIRILDLRSRDTGSIVGPHNIEQMQETIERCVYPLAVGPLISAIRKSDNW